jgi:polyphosphate:AMP phosphotransferase
MFEAVELGQKLSKKAYEDRVPGIREALLDAQARLADADFATVIVLAGAEGAGKGESLHTLLEWLDARGIEAHALGFPSSEEAERPPFYRFWRRLPAHGKIGVFFGSWYTGPIVGHLSGNLDDDGFDRQLSRIVDFERMLVDEGTLLLKFWLHISKKQQKQRLKQLAADPDTAWRVGKEDWAFHKTYDPFVLSSTRALRRTSTGDAPWNVVEAWDKRFRHMTIAEGLVKALETRLDAPPAMPPAPEPLPAPPKLDILNSVDLSVRVEPEPYARKLAKYQGRLGRLARRMSDAGCSAVLVFEGSDAAGKGGCIRRVVQALDARFFRVIPVAAPTDEEAAHPYLWRFWRQLPGRGGFTIYDRSWYGRVLVERVEGFASSKAWRRAYSEINAFEEQLVEAGVLVQKFWLTIGEDEQLKRFEEREATAHKRYKITAEDWRNRGKWKAYEAAACDMIERTGTEFAPWTIVEAQDKRYARIKVLKTLCAGLEQQVGPDEKPRSGKSVKRKKKS